MALAIDRRQYSRPEPDCHCLACTRFDVRKSFDLDLVLDDEAVITRALDALRDAMRYRPLLGPAADAEMTLRDALDRTRRMRRVAEAECGL